MLVVEVMEITGSLGDPEQAEAAEEKPAAEKTAAASTQVAVREDLVQRRCLEREQMQGHSPFEGLDTSVGPRSVAFLVQVGGVRESRRTRVLQTWDYTACCLGCCGGQLDLVLHQWALADGEKEIPRTSQARKTPACQDQLVVVILHTAKVPKDSPRCHAGTLVEEMAALAAGQL